MHEAHDLGKTGHGYVLSHLSYKDTMNCLQNMSFNLTMPTLLLDLESSSICCNLALVERLLDQ